MMNESETDDARHTLTYRIRNTERQDTLRTIEVCASREEVRQLVEQGYLVREGLVADRLEALRAGLDEVLARETGSRAAPAGPQRFSGIFLRHLMEKHPAFLELFRFEPLLSIARAVLGPQVQVRPMTARVSYPDEVNQGTQWHFHQRVIPDPMPAFFTRPHVIDCLLYLDDVDAASGPVCVVPGSHRWIEEDLEAQRFDEIRGQVTLLPRAGDCVIVHGALWHRAMPTTPAGSLRRMLIQPYAAAWLSLPSYGVRPENGLMRPLFENPDPETKELLGIAEGLY
jgi:ectoine hydroxylase-related dioxygenase (phytanoyl-CoA dioxygenase family)